MVTVRLLGRPWVAPLAAALLGLSVLWPWPAVAQTRIKDMAVIESVGDIPLVGQGLVVGLPGTGDDLRRSPVAAQMMAQGLGGRGMSAAEASQAARTMGGRDVAAVTVTARLSRGLQPGARFDVSVAAMGEARSLQGGTLVPTALLGGDGQVWAVAEGPVSAHGFAVQGAAQKLGVGTATTGQITGGATLERSMPAMFQDNAGPVRLLLRNPDFTTAKRVADAVNGFAGSRLARMRDNTLITIDVPADYPDGAPGLIAAIEGLSVMPDRGADRIIIDSASGLIVAGADVAVAPSAISHGALTVRVSENPQVSQPAPFSSGGQTVVVPRTSIEVSDGAGRVISTGTARTVGALLATLKAAGLSTREQISVLQGLRAAGSIGADLVAR